MKKLLLLTTFILFGITNVFAQQGFTCSNAIPIPTLPYSTTDNTANYGDVAPLEGLPGSSGGCGTGSNYLNGNDVVYSYTATSTSVINVMMSPTAVFSGIFAYASCADIGTNCLAGVANGNTSLRSFDLSVTAGATYYIVISTWAAPQTTAYTLTIQTLNCLLPTNLSANNITQSSAQLSWANPGGATSWEVSVQTEGTISTGSGTTVNTNNNYLASELTSGTAYQYYVRANCGNGTFSGWAGPYAFTTLCNAFSVPFQEGFNSTSSSESCWTILNTNNDVDSWNTNYVTSPFEGNQSATLTTDFNAGNNNDWLISPQIVLTGNQVLKFHYRVQSNFEPNEFSVLLSTTGTNTANFTTTLIPLTTYDNTVYTQATVSLAGFTGPVNIAWHVPTGTLDGWRIFIDNVIVDDIATCPEPSTVTATDVTPTSANIGWLENGSATNWEILTVPCGAPAPTATSIGQSVTSNPFIINGLLPSTCYNVYVKSVCNANEDSVWSFTPATFTTLITPPICGGTFTDNGGPNGNYSNNSDSVVTICPETAGEIVTVNFTSFSTESGWDGLYVFDGNSITAPQIASSNLAGPGLNLPGAFWGTSIPGPFLSTSPDGCLTFHFRSDGTANRPGWMANVVCIPAPNCIKPTNLTLNSVTQTSIAFGWTENENATSWEVLALPAGSASPSQSTSGQLVSSNSATISGLASGTTYNLYARSVCPSGGYSFWSLPLNANTLITNDECDAASVVPVNYNGCAQVTQGRITGATASSVPLSEPCIGTADDDVWFQFIATNTSVVTSLQNVIGTSNNLNMALYSGTCGNLSQLNCSAANASSLVNSNLIIGNTYFLRVYSNAATPQDVSFNLCVTTPSTCIGGESICGVNNYANSTGIPSLGSIGCLFTSPNPTYFNIKISESGSINMLLTQSTIGSGTANIDVDYAAWGPFQDQATACAAISGGMPPGIGGNTTTQSTGCSYSASPTEHFNIANAIAGEYYIILITNFSNQAGFINLTVENTSTGSIDCTGIRMQAFIDNNANGTKEADEAYFPLGQFQYEINNNGTIHNITSPSGVYSIYDDNPSNSYDLDYSIDTNYAATYSTNASYDNVIVTSAGMTTYNFPITVLQNHNDLGVTIVPVNAPRAGTTYKNKIVYTNNGTQTIAAGTLTYTVNAGTAITNISQSGTTAISNGFTYNFTSLLPFETRTITVTISVPSIPTVAIGQLLTNTASIVPPSGDIVAGNDTSASTQAIIAAYDPNDKTESHGDKILFSSFTSDDYLEYTIRFENNGNAGAIDVVVSDVLDSQLDETSLIMTNASHSYTLDRVSNTLVWTFANILLPVSIPDTDIGKGFITFKIKPKPGYTVGDIIPNNASIFFDTNPAIVTNTFNTEFVAALGNNTFTFNSVLLYPNPATQLVNISIPNSDETLESVVIHDMLGKKIQTISGIASNQITIDVANFAKGVYLVEITSNHNVRLIKKLIIQ